MDILENGSSGPMAPRAVDPSRWLMLIAACVVLIAACSAFTAWTVYRQTEMSRDVQCAYISADPSRLDGEGDEGDVSFDDLQPIEQEIVRALDCDIEGR